MREYRVNFDRLKEDVSFGQVITMLDLRLKREGSDWRGRCPACKDDSKRPALWISPTHFRCHASAESHAKGDIINLVRHVRGLRNREAAEAIAEHFGIDHSQKPEPASPQVPARSQPAPVAREEPRKGTFDPEKILSELAYEHEAVAALGLKPDQAEALGIGFKKAGLHARMVVFPLYRDGAIVGFAGLDGGLKLPKQF